MEDSEIIALFLRRDENAIAEAEKKYGPYCLTTALRIVGSREDAEECVNDTWLKTWNSIPPNEPDSLRAYLAGITRNGALNRWRERHREKRGMGETAAALEELAECLPDDSADTNPVRQADARALEEAINAFLRGLPERERYVFTARYYYMCPIPEIARKFGVSKNTVWAILKRERDTLRAKLEREGWQI